MTTSDFEPVAIVDPFEHLVGQYLRSRGDPPHTYALSLEPRHANAYGGLHGGALMTFADMATGQVAWDAVHRRRPVVTLAMNVTFQSSAPVPSLLTMQPRVTRQTSTVMFIDGEMKVDELIVAGVSSVWKVLRGETAFDAMLAAST